MCRGWQSKGTTLVPGMAEQGEHLCAGDGRAKALLMRGGWHSEENAHVRGGIRQ